MLFKNFPSLLLFPSNADKNLVHIHNTKSDSFIVKYCNHLHGNFIPDSLCQLQTRLHIEFSGSGSVTRRQNPNTGEHAMQILLSPGEIAICRNISVQ